MVHLHPPVVGIAAIPQPVDALKQGRLMTKKLQFSSSFFRLAKLLIERLCILKELTEDEKEEFTSYALEKVVIAFKKFKGKSSERTYLTIVIRNAFQDFIRQKRGRWRVPQKVKKLGQEAELLFTLRYREGRDFDDAYNILSSCFNSVPSVQVIKDLWEKLEEFYTRQKPVYVSFEDITARELYLSSLVENVDSSLTEQKYEELIVLLEKLVNELPEDYRLILRMHFEQGVKISALARIFNTTRGKMERRIKKILKVLKEQILKAGVKEDLISETLKKI